MLFREKKVSVYLLRLILLTKSHLRQWRIWNLRKKARGSGDEKREVFCYCNINFEVSESKIVYTFNTNNHSFSAKNWHNFTEFLILHDSYSLTPKCVMICFRRNSVRKVNQVESCIRRVDVGRWRGRTPSAAATTTVAVVVVVVVVVVRSTWRW